MSETLKLPIVVTPVLEAMIEISAMSICARDTSRPGNRFRQRQMTERLALSADEVNVLASSRILLAMQSAEEHQPRTFPGEYSERRLLPAKCGCP